MRAREESAIYVRRRRRVRRRVRADEEEGAPSAGVCTFLLLGTERCSVLFLNSDRSRHPPHPCFKVLRF